MISINKPTAAFVKQYRESGGGAQLLNISVVDPAELVKLAGLKNAHGLGISQVVPYPYMANLPVIREYQELLEEVRARAGRELHQLRGVPGRQGAGRGTAPRRPEPDARQGDEGAGKSMGSYDLGGITVNYSPGNRVGSRFVEVTVIGSTGKLLK